MLFAHKENDEDFFPEHMAKKRGHIFDKRTYGHPYHAPLQVRVDVACRKKERMVSKNQRCNIKEKQIYMHTAYFCKSSYHYF